MVDASLYYADRGIIDGHVDLNDPNDGVRDAELDEVTVELTTWASPTVLENDHDRR